MPDGAAIGFEVDGFARRMILDGTDELGYLLNLEPQLAAYEAAHPPRVSTLSPSEAGGGLRGGGSSPLSPDISLVPYPLTVRRSIRGRP